MIERIVAWCATHKAIVLSAFALIIIVGIWAVSTTPLDAIPDLSENQVIVYTEYMGRSPQVIEDQITFPLVSSLQGLAKVKAVRAQSMFGMSFVYIIFDDDVDLYWARTRVLEKLATVQSTLPTGAKTALGPDGTGVGHVYWYTVEGKGYDLEALRSLQDWFIKPQLQSVEGVAEVASAGGFVREYQINLDPRKMQLLNVGLTEVSNAVLRSNSAVGGKIIEVNGRENFVRGQGYLSSLQDLRSISIGANAGVPVLLGQVADVTLGPLPRRGSLDKNGEGEAVGGIIVMRSGENAKEVIDRVKAKIAEIEPGLPQNIHLVPAYDRSEIIIASVKNLTHTLIEEAIIVTIIVLLFLLHAPSALRIVIEIPVSVLIAFILMRMFGVTSNIMSLGGIAIGIGVLVDASIVMLENAHRHLAEAQERKKKDGVDFDYTAIVIRSAQQVARAIFFSILIIVVSFLPVFLLTGQEGKLFHPLAFTKTFSLLGSAVVSITLVPVLMTLLMKGRFRKEEANPVSRFFVRLYQPALRWALHNRAVTIALNVAALLIAIPIAISIGSEFMPPLDEGSLLFMPTLLPSVSVSEATRIMQLQDGIIKAYPEVEQVLGKVGKAETATDPAPVSMIETIIQLKPHNIWRPGITKEKIIEELNRRLQMPGVSLGWTQPIINRINMLSTGVRTDLGIKIYGANLDTLEKLAIAVEGLLKPISGSADVVAERTQAGSFLDITLKPEAVRSFGLNPAAINGIIEAAIGGIDAGTVVDGRARYPITVRYAKDYRSSIEQLNQLLIPVPIAKIGNSSAITSSIERASNDRPSTIGSGSANDGSGMSGSSAMNSSPGSSMTPSAMPATNSSVRSPTTSRSLLESTSGVTTQYLPLGQIANIALRPGPSMIASENAMLRSIVYLNVRGRDMGSFVNDAKRVLQTKLALPAGYTISWSGQYEQQQHAKQRLMIVVPIVFLLIFLLLFVTLHDAKEAAIVMLSVPFALIGGVYLIWTLGYNWSVAVWVGFIALYGVATETGVVMVVYLHEALDKKLRAVRLGEKERLTEADLYEATMQGAVLRLRPKIMTVATAMLGLIPIMYSTGVGADVMKPIAAPMIGGMLTSAIHVLIVTPIIFYMLKRRQLQRGTLRESGMAKWLH